jgi:hypothetical protein
MDNARDSLGLIYFWCFNATFSNISAVSWRPVLVVEEARVPGQPPTIGKQVVNFIIIQDFDRIVLDEAVLGVARMFREELVVMPHDEDYNRSNRYAAYRQYTIWAHAN